MKRNSPTWEKFFVQSRGCNSAAQYGFERPMYADPSEVVNLIKLAIREKTGKIVVVTRALESGVVEEHAVVEKSDGRKNLLFRVWPVFYAHHKRVEYKIYAKDPTLQKIILRYLNIFATTNQATLTKKE